MYIGMGLRKNRHGVWIVRYKVPKPLEEPVARVLDNGKERQTYLQKTTGTKDQREAKRIAPTVLVDFRKTLDEAEALLAERPLRTSLAQSEIDRIAEFHYASVLAGDEAYTVEGAQADEDFIRSIADQLSQTDIEYTMPLPLDDHQPTYGLTNRQVTKRNGELPWWLPTMREALARGNISVVSEAMTELLDRFHLNLDRNSAAYRQLGLAVLRANVRALEALERRYNGEPVDTPPLVEPKEAPAAGDTLRAAFAGWKKDKKPAPGSLTEYERAIDLFIQLHGDLHVAQIKRPHARAYREALREMPRTRTAELTALPLPALAEWGRTHPEAQKISPSTVNKQFGAVQAIANWARENDVIPDDVEWSDPFAKMRLDEDAPEGGPFEPSDLRALFTSAVFTSGECAAAGQGDVAFWLPLLALFTGARRSELAMLLAADVRQDEATDAWTLAIYEDLSKRKTLKTKGSERPIPVHPELVRIGFLRFVDTMRKDGTDVWLFPAVSPERPGGAKAWTKWFRRYLNELGITDRRKGLHSLRHNFKDALRTGGVPEDLNDALTGHLPHNVGGKYGHKVIVKRFGMPRLVDAIAKMDYPNLDLTAIHWKSGQTKLPTRAKRKSRAAAAVT
jgi:integrase